MKSLLLFKFILVCSLGFSQNLKWVKGVGGIVVDISYSAQVDSYGNVYTMGNYRGSVDFDPSNGTFILKSTTGIEGSIFILKMSPDGEFIWAKSLDISTGGEMPSLTIDNTGNLLLTGAFYYTSDFDPGLGVVSLTSAGYGDIFVLKLNSNGNFIWIKKMGGNDVDAGHNIIVDSKNNIYTTGRFSGSVDFDPGQQTYILNSRENVFIQKLDSSGNFIWAKAFVSNYYPCCSRILAIDKYDNLYSLGTFLGNVDFDLSAKIYNMQSNGSYDLFILKMNEKGDFMWAKSIKGATNNSFGNTIIVKDATIDNNTNIYLTGNFIGTYDFDPSGDGFNMYSYSRDAFILKLNESGNFSWAKKIGGKGNDYGTSIKVDKNGFLYTLGDFEDSLDIDPGVNINNLYSFGSQDVFILKTDTSSNYIWSYQIGEDLSEDGGSIALDNSNNIVSTGSFAGTPDFDMSSNSQYLVPVGSNDVYILKIDSQILTNIDSDNQLNVGKYNIYPNPTNSHLNIQSTYKHRGLTYSIKDQAGKVLLNGKLLSENDLIDISSLDSGFYFLFLHDSDNLIYKIVKN